MLEDVLENCLKPLVEVNGLGFVDIPPDIRCKKLIVKMDRYGCIASLAVVLIQKDKTPLIAPEHCRIYKLGNWVLIEDVLMSLRPHLKELTPAQQKHVLINSCNVFDNGLYSFQWSGNIILMNNAEFSGRTSISELHGLICAQSFDLATFDNQDTLPVICVYS
jgi:hypothetical protein